MHPAWDNTEEQYFRKKQKKNLIGLHQNWETFVLFEYFCASKDTIKKCEKTTYRKRKSICKSYIWLDIKNIHI
jgi:hypothetical protein